MLCKVVGVMVVMMMRCLDSVPLATAQLDVVKVPHKPLLECQSRKEHLTE